MNQTAVTEVTVAGSDESTFCPRRKPAEWHCADWSTTDSEIAKVLGVSRERVRQIRRRLQKPRPQSFHQHHRSIRMREWLEQNRNLAQNLPVEELIAEAGIAISPPKVRDLLLGMGIATHPGSKADMAATNPSDRLAAATP